MTWFKKLRKKKSKSIYDNYTLVQISTIEHPFISAHNIDQFLCFINFTDREIYSEIPLISSDHKTNTEQNINEIIRFLLIHLTKFFTTKFHRKVYIIIQEIYLMETRLVWTARYKINPYHPEMFKQKTIKEAEK